MGGSVFVFDMLNSNKTPTYIRDLGWSLVASKRRTHGHVRVKKVFIFKFLFFLVLVFSTGCHTALERD